MSRSVMWSLFQVKAENSVMWWYQIFDWLKFASLLEITVFVPAAAIIFGSLSRNCLYSGPSHFSPLASSFVEFFWLLVLAYNFRSTDGLFLNLLSRFSCALRLFRE